MVAEAMRCHWPMCHAQTSSSNELFFIFYDSRVGAPEQLDASSRDGLALERGSADPWDPQIAFAATGPSHPRSSLAAIRLTFASNSLKPHS